jgi:hypothetical protein
MGRYIAFKRYFDLARTVDCPASWRTVYMLGLMSITAVEHGTIVAFVGHGEGADWPDARYPDEEKIRSRKARP